jgi:predicted nucleic acid-binding Zn ribbon protein
MAAMNPKKCIVCGKAKADHYRVCRECAKTHDSTTGDRIRTGKGT